MADLPEELSETYNYKCIINREDTSKHALNKGVTKYWLQIGLDKNKNNYSLKC